MTRLKLAELTSGVGALVLSAGLRATVTSPPHLPVDARFAASSDPGGAGHDND